ncbi:MAG: CPBP family intramembrane glutamic endopeptidase [Bryobacteraceae bacterium]
MDTAERQRLARVLAVIWVAGSISAYFYSAAKGVPAAVAIPVALAFLVEISFYATLGTRALRGPWVLAASGLASFLVYSVPTGVFSAKGLLLLAGLAAASALWLRLLPGWLDAGYLAFVAGVYLLKLVREPYVEPLPDMKLGVSALGQLMWFRIGMASLLAERDYGRMGFGFIPSAGEWRVGLRNFLLLLPSAAVVIWAVDFAHLRLAPGFWWKGPATFIGILWVVALGEEAFFRGVLLERLRERAPVWLAVAVSSVVFGSVHLWFGDAFPNWKHAVVATVLGVFCARAYLAGPGIRAAMVTHALAVTFWRVFLVS